MVLTGLRERFGPLTARIFPRRVLLVLEDDGLTLLALRGQGFKPAASLLHRVPLPRGACQDGRPLQQAALGDLIGDLMLELGLHGAEVIASLPRAACSLRVVQWPFEEWPEEPEEALRQIDPDLRLACPLAQSYLCLTPLGGADPALPLCSLLVTAPRALVLEWVEVFAIAALDLERLEPAQVAELRAVAPLLAEAPANELTALIECQAGGAELTLIRQGIPEFSRHLPADPRALDQALRQCLNFWRQRDPQMRSVRLLLFGSSRRLAGVAEALGREETWSLEILDPLQRGWLDLEENAADSLGPSERDGPGLLRLSGLAQAERAP